MKKILIVEDDKEMHVIYKDMLSFDYKLTFAENTKSAMKELNKGKFDLMILDIIMPEESGDTFFQRIKKNAKFKSLKTLCITVLGDESDFFQSIDPKSQCLPKPVDKDKLLKVVKDMVGE